MTGKSNLTNGLIGITHKRIVQSTVCVFLNEPAPSLGERTRCASKILIASFLSLTAYLMSVPSGDQRIVNAKRLIKCLPETYTAFSSRRSNTDFCGRILHLDEASVHSTIKTMDFLDITSVKLLAVPIRSHMTYLFPKIKIKTIQEMTAFINEDALTVYVKAIEEVKQARATYAEH
ncbi:hypothetical protein EVAR_96813_1 [Eumeta japonica]|uniref:DDE-1 domain-containing protein n=1 Tax=Eumeta variegata TaxID=151549 RepID=A0A4C1WDH6_EUMVA|nr:hypothetical protein EVAR_96813_1 [Eumeta japonica]